MNVLAYLKIYQSSSFIDASYTEFFISIIFFVLDFKGPIYLRRDTISLYSRRKHLSVVIKIVTHKKIRRQV